VKLCKTVPILLTRRIGESLVATSHFYSSTLMIRSIWRDEEIVAQRAELRALSVAFSPREKKTLAERNDGTANASVTAGDVHTSIQLPN
jgi:hypothetical protein